MDPATMAFLGKTALPLLTGAFMSKPKGYDVQGIMSNYNKYMQPGINAFQGMQNQANQFYDVNSEFNQRLQNQFSNMTADRLAQNNRMNTSNAIRFGGLPGMVNAQNNASGVGFTQAGLDAFNKAYSGNVGMGSNLLTSAAQGLTGIGQQQGDSYGNLMTANTDMQNQWSSGMGQNLMSFGLDQWLNA